MGKQLVVRKVWKRDYLKIFGAPYLTDVVLGKLTRVTCSRSI